MQVGEVIEIDDNAIVFKLLTQREPAHGELSLSLCVLALTAARSASLVARG